MACPYFYPVSRLEEAPWAFPPRLPLGDAYTGECRAGAIALEPEDAILRGSCNNGYAREKCRWFPRDAPADAIRFHVTSDAGDVIFLQYIFEKGCWPSEHGDASYSVTGQALSAAPSNEVARRQALVFIEGYLRRAR